MNKVLDDILYSFVRTKRTLFTRVSSKLMYNEKKQERIDDYAQELDRQDVWMAGQREVSMVNLGCWVMEVSEDQCK